MQINPLWNLWDKRTTFPELINNKEVDVCIVGGGITGILSACMLKERGFKVAVVEAKCIGKGTTGQSTGNLYSVTEDLYSIFLSKYNKEILKEILNSRHRGMEIIKKYNDLHEIDCNFQESDMYIFEEENNTVAQEMNAAKDADLDIMNLPSDFQYKYSSGFYIKGQAQFNPLLFVQQLASKIQSANCEIFENSPVLEVNKNDQLFNIRTSQGTINSEFLIEATHTPKGLKTEYHTNLGSYREYGIAATLKNSHYPDKGIFWKYSKDEKFSFRTYERGDSKFLIGVGQSHKVGQAESTRKLLDNLIQTTENMFKIERVKYCWGGQNYKPSSYLPYIGEIETDSKHYIATGFSADGLVYGALAALIINDSILSVENPWSDLFQASKKRPVKAAKRFIKENVNVATQIIKDLGADEKNLNHIPIGSGEVVKINGKKVAVYRQDGDSFHKVSAICPHIGCTVRWNDAETSWDCPCHGSRFNVNGDVIEGPSLGRLSPMEDKLSEIN